MTLNYWKIQIKEILNIDGWINWEGQRGCWLAYAQWLAKVSQHLPQKNIFFIYRTTILLGEVGCNDLYYIILDVRLILRLMCISIF